MKKRITYIISDIDKALAFEWVATRLSRTKYDLDFVLLNPEDSVLQQFLEGQGITVKFIRCRGKKDWSSAWWQTFRYLRQRQPDIVHCHLLQANIIGLTAAKAAGIKQRVYTRHHSSLHHVYHRKGIIWDRMANRIATDIIAISENVKRILQVWERAPEHKIRLIPHGFSLDSFRHVSDQRIHDIRQKYDMVGRHPVIGVISRFTEWKGVQFIIPAFKKYIAHNPDAVLFLLNAKGDYEAEIFALLVDIPDKNYRIVAFEQDNAAALKAMDMFVHVPINEHVEAFGQIYVEALAAGVPSIFSLSGIATDFIRNEQNALVVPFNNSEAIYQAMEKMMHDSALREKLIEEGWHAVRDTFDLTKMIDQLERVYDA